ncbi:MAG: hypothetical protein ABEI57_07250 [Halapricum sp.]
MTLGERSGGRMTAEKPSESFCEECGARITSTDRLGEVGHQPDCSRREEAYRGRDAGEFPGTREAMR